MKSLFQFLLKNSIFLLFVLLEIVSLILIIRHNEYPQSATFSSANRIAAGIYSVSNSVSNYFHLSAENADLVAENTALRNQLAQLREQQTYINDSILSNRSESPLTYVSARVIDKTTYRQKNYLTLDKGSKDGITPDMGVINKDGVVGMVMTVSDHYALVIPILHPAFALSCKIASNGYTTTLQWDGKDYRYAQLSDIGRHIDIHKGDTIVTSGLSAIFPEGITIGCVYDDELNENDAYHKTQVALSVDFKRLRNVTIIQNKDLHEIQQLKQELTAQ